MSFYLARDLSREIIETETDALRERAIRSGRVCLELVLDGIVNSAVLRYDPFEVWRQNWFTYDWERVEFTEA